MILECIPNFSTIDPVILDKLKLAITSQPKTKLLHVDPGKSANRTVMTFAGPMKSVIRSARAMLSVSTQDIDMRRQQGTHPRIGACDVLPFVPLGSWEQTSTEKLKKTIVEMAQEFSQRSGLPFYFYEELAKTEERRNLAFLRRGQFEGLSERMQKKGMTPDIGPTNPHPSAGVTAVGIRNLLLAFNINIQTTDLAKVRSIATKLRCSNTQSPYDFPGLKTLGWWVEEFEMCQVSTNITQINSVNLIDLYEAVKQEASLLNLKVAGCELVGLMPQIALDAAKKRLGKSEEETIQFLGLNRIKAFQTQQNILENVVKSAGLNIF